MFIVLYTSCSLLYFVICFHPLLVSLHTHLTPPLVLTTSPTRLNWNKQDPNYLAVIPMDSNNAIILDIRLPSVPAAELTGHSNPINAIAWAPHSSCRILILSFLFFPSFLPHLLPNKKTNESENSSDCFQISAQQGMTSRPTSGTCRPCPSPSRTPSWPTAPRPRSTSFSGASPSPTGSPSLLVTKCKFWECDTTIINIKSCIFRQLHDNWGVREENWRTCVSESAALRAHGDILRTGGGSNNWTDSTAMKVTAVFLLLMCLHVCIIYLSQQ